MGQDYKPSQQTDKQKRYKYVLQSFKAVISGQTHPLSNISNFIALLKEQFKWYWVGFYFVSKQNQLDILVLGPFQGPLACTLIKKGKGVCGTSWEKQQPVIVQDVEKFPGHIACSSASKSQIVLPIFSNKKCVGVFDIDSEFLSLFDEIDEKYLKEMLEFLQNFKTWEWVQKSI